MEGVCDRREGQRAPEQALVVVGEHVAGDEQRLPDREQVPRQSPARRVDLRARDQPGDAEAPDQVEDEPAVEPRRPPEAGHDVAGRGQRHQTQIRDPRAIGGPRGLDQLDGSRLSAGARHRPSPASGPSTPGRARPTPGPAGACAGASAPRARGVCRAVLAVAAMRRRMTLPRSRSATGASRPTRPPRLRSRACLLHRGESPGCLRADEPSCAKCRRTGDAAAGRLAGRG